jgi:Patatin-like phospholipase
MTGSVSDLSQDVRVAVAMTGGVSLAVWMGGIAREINLLQQASNLRPRATTTPAPTAVPGSGAQDLANSSSDLRARDLYLRLIDVLDVTVTVDVLSGTSAGGINAAMLGLSSAAGVDLAGLRDLWLAAGSLDVLLRDPGEKNPSALMARSSRTSIITGCSHSPRTR